MYGALAFTGNMKMKLLFLAHMKYGGLPLLELS